MSYTPINITGADVTASGTQTVTNANVIKINGTSVPATPTAGQTLVATSGTVATWELLPVTSLATGSTTQVLLMDGSIPTWTTLSQDATVNATGVITVVSAHGNFQVNGNLIVVGTTTLENNTTAENLGITGNLAQFDGYVQLNGNQASFIETTGVASSLTITAAAASTWSVGGAAQTLTIDTSGILDLGISTATSVSIGKTGSTLALQGVVISGTAPSAGYTLIATSGVAAAWTAPSGDITLAGDVTGLANANTVKTMQGLQTRAEAANYTVNTSGTDFIIFANSSGGILTITLPATPATGSSYIIKDSTGSASTHNITVSGNGNNVDSAATYVINVNYASVNVVFNGTIWNII